MARAVWSGAITFGLVNIPIKVYGATEEKDLRFTTLHATCKTPLKRPYICPVCNTPVESKDMIKGYEYGKGNYVLLSDEEMDSVEVETSKAISVLGFVDVDEIGPLFYEKSYYLGSEETSTKPFELLRQALCARTRSRSRRRPCGRRSTSSPSARLGAPSSSRSSSTRTR